MRTGLHNSPSLIRYAANETSGRLQKEIVRSLRLPPCDSNMRVPAIATTAAFSRQAAHTRRRRINTCVTKTGRQPTVRSGVARATGIERDAV